MYLRIVSSGASTVASSVRSVGASVASSIAERYEETIREQGAVQRNSRGNGLFSLRTYLTNIKINIRVSQKYNLIYVITKLGLLFVFDLEMAAAVYRNRISPDPIFLTSEASSVGGFYAINRRGQVLLAKVNEATIVSFVSGQLNNLEIAANLARRGNLPGAENLVSTSEEKSSEGNGNSNILKERVKLF